MREIRREALVPFSAPDMFDLIERVEDYPQFLPWCMATQLLERTGVTVRATVEVGVRDLRVRVTTRPSSWRYISRVDRSGISTASGCCGHSATAAVM
jgi:ribosome-associated toxin RatA of RatAB toxin-antitoxin module